MTNHTRRQIIAAYEALDALCARAGKETNAALKIHILSALPPKPRPTMAEIEWDNERHYLAEAETGKGLKAIMLHPVPDMGILCLQKANGTHRPYYFKTDYLTPTGKRYTLTEVQDD